VILTDWRDGLIWQVVTEILDEGADPAEACRRFETQYFRLHASELIAAREGELEHERRERLLEILCDTDPMKAVTA
jgi:hypothetical protein